VSLRDFFCLSNCFVLNLRSGRGISQLYALYGTLFHGNSTGNHDRFNSCLNWRNTVFNIFRNHNVCATCDQLNHSTTNCDLPYCDHSTTNYDHSTTNCDHSTTTIWGEQEAVVLYISDMTEAKFEKRRVNFTVAVKKIVGNYCSSTPQKCDESSPESYQVYIVPGYPMEDPYSPGELLVGFLSQ
ncbi:unnamed protein product, partial [Pocillopora meandrina]